MLKKFSGVALLAVLSLPITTAGQTHAEEKDYGLIARLANAIEDDYIRRGEIYSGKVLALTEDTITVQKGTRIPRTFSVAPPLTSKRIPLEWQCGCGHRLGDVRVGDTVSFFLAPTPRGHVVIALGIYRRPGGTIPPAEDDQLPEKCRIHNRWNARQTVEEKIIPRLPQVFLRFHP